MKSLVMKQMSYMSTAGYMCSSVCITESCGSLLIIEFPWRLINTKPKQ